MVKITYFKSFILLLFLFLTNVSFSQQPKLVLPVGHKISPYSASFSPNGKWLISLGTYEVCLWELSSGRLLHTFKEESQNGFVSAKFLNNSTQLLTLHSGIVKIWDIKTLNLVYSISMSDKITSYILSEDEKHIITSTDNLKESVSIWEINTGKLILTIDVNLYGKKNIQYSPDKKTILVKANSLSGYSDINVYDIKNGNKTITLNNSPYGFKSASFSPPSINDPKGGKYVLVVLSYENFAQIYETETGKLLHTILDHDGFIVNAIFTPDGKMVITETDDGLVKVWNINKGKISHNLNYQNKSIDFKISPSIQESKNVNFYILTMSNDEFSIWTNNNKEYNYRKSENVNRTAFSSNGSCFITINTQGFIKIWETKTGALISNLEGEVGYVESVIFSPDDQYILATTDKGVVLWNVDGKRINNFKGYTNWFENAEFSPDGKMILSISKNQNPQIWKPNEGKMLFLEGNGLNWPVKFAKFTSDGKKVIHFNNNLLFISNTHDGSLHKIIGSDTLEFQTASLSPDTKKILTTRYFEEINLTEIWDIETGKLIREFGGHDYYIENAIFSPDGDKILSISSKEVFVYETNSGKLLLFFKGDFSRLKSHCFSNDNEKLMIVTKNDIYVWNTITGKPIDFNIKTNFDIMDANFSPNSTEILIKGLTKAEIIYLYSKKESTILDQESYQLEFSMFSPNGEKIVTAGMGTPLTTGIGYKSIPKIWDTKTGKLLHKLEGSDYNISLTNFSPNGKYLVTIPFNSKTIDVWCTETGKLLHNLNADNNGISSASFNSDGNLLVTTFIEGSYTIWDIKEGKKVIQHYVFAGNEHVLLLPTGDYMASPKSASLIYYIKGIQTLGFEQLDIKYNRPDKVLEAFGRTDTLLIESYRKAYEKRIKKLGIDTSAFRDDISVPEADFANRDHIKFEQKKETLELRIKGNDSLYKLDRYNVWVNEVPIYGQKGISIKDLNLNKLDLKLSIQLSEGENRIETSITNVNGIESYRMPLYVKYTPSQPIKEKIHLIGIGIDKFTDNSHNLKFCVKDIHDLAGKLKEKYGKDIIIDTLFNENVTLNKVKNLKKRLYTTNVNDKVIIAYSGHGLLSKDFDYFLSTHSVNFNDPTIDGLPYDELENLLDSIPARKKLMLIDACHSGEVDKDDLVKINTDSNSALIKGSIPVAYKQNEKHLGLKNSFELMQSIFVNVGKSTGATIISASAGTQFALEKNDLKNGVFTYSILEALQQHDTLKVSELKSIVSKRVEELTNGLQKPTSRNETISVDWNIWE